VDYNSTFYNHTERMILSAGIHHIYSHDQLWYYTDENEEKVNKS
jgi:hypothetical protein